MIRSIRKNFLLVFIGVVCCFSASAQCKHTRDHAFSKRIYSLADSMPEYKGGGPAMLQFIAENYHYPEHAEFQTSFKIDFVVDKRGRVVNIRVASKSKEQETPAEKELIRVMSSMPHWKPGMCHGKKVRVQMYLPLYF